MNTIIVAGDIAIDWLAWQKDISEYPSENRSQFNWIKNTGLNMRAFPGGALLLSHLVSFSLKDNHNAKVFTYHLKNLENIPPSKIIHSMTLCDGYPIQSGRQEMVFRVKQHCGYSGPESGITPALKLTHDDPDATHVVLDDGGNGFRSQKDAWPAAILIPRKKPIIILKMSYPLAEGPLWEHIFHEHADRSIIIVNARDLRASGADISYRLSWEHTAETLLKQIENNLAIRPLTMCKALIVRFGVEGAILFTRIDGKECARLFYDPARCEDEFFSQYPGSMQGMFCAFTAGFISSLLQSDNIDDCIFSGMLSSRNLIKYGFGSFPGIPNYDFPNIFSINGGDRDEVADTIIPQSKNAEEGGVRWTILESVTQSQLEEIGENIVLSGTHPSLIPVPVGSFGALRTVDRKEIESYQSIRNILQEYIHSDNAKPISIAVFGPPGSGKSFGVTQLAKSIAKEKIVTLEFNLAQFKDIKDLTAAFNAIQDNILEGKIPLVFFDEFDGDFNGSLGWLKFFLAPMQDGKFKDGEQMHPIGKSIFVFAGGTCNTFQQFRNGRETEDSTIYQNTFRNAKGTDFISRLRGYVDIVGCTGEEDQDSTCIIRRALLLRSIIEQYFDNLLDTNGTARIDRALVRAFLHVPAYRHGIRSMQAIFQMSRISTKEQFNISDLPSVEQLKLHVKIPEFTDLILQYSLLESAIGAIAQKIHEQYLKTMKSLKSTSSTTVRWDELSSDYHASNKEAARHITEKLKTIDCWFAPKDPKEITLYKFEPNDLLTLAKMEHTRWCREKTRKGWKYGKIKSDEKKHHPDLVPWEKLSKKSKKKDYDAVENIPKIMAEIGFEIYKIN